MKIRTYEEMAKIGRDYYSDSNYCSIIAIAIACDKSYGKVYNDMKKLGRRDNRGANIIQIKACVRKYKKEMVTLTERQGATFSTCSKSAHKHAGTVRLHLSKGHIAAQINGKLEDWSHKSLIRITHTFEVR